MALRGNLKDFSLPDVFQLVTFSRKTGVLRIRRADDAQGSVWFRDGEVFFASSNWRAEPLGARLVKAQRITPQALQRTLDIRVDEPADGRRLGAILIDEGYITEGVLEAFVREQIQDTIFDLMRWDEGEFDFEAMPEAVEEDIGLSVSIENIVMEGSRRLEEWSRIKRKIPSTDVVFKMATAPGEGTFEISLKPTEWQLLLLIDATRSVADLATETHRTDFEVARVLYGLFSAGLLEFATDSDVERSRAERAAREARLAEIDAERRIAEEAERAAQSAETEHAATQAVEYTAVGQSPPAVEPQTDVSEGPIEVPEFLEAASASPTAEDQVVLEEFMGALLSHAEDSAPTPEPVPAEPYIPAEEPAFMSVERAQTDELSLAPADSIADLLGLTPQAQPEREEPQVSPLTETVPEPVLPEDLARAYVQLDSGAETEPLLEAEGDSAAGADQADLLDGLAAHVETGFERDLMALGLGELPQDLVEPVQDEGALAGPVWEAEEVSPEPSAEPALEVAEDVGATQGVEPEMPASELEPIFASDLQPALPPELELEPEPEPQPEPEPEPGLPPELQLEPEPELDSDLQPDYVLPSELLRPSEAEPDVSADELFEVTSVPDVARRFEPSASGETDFSALIESLDVEHDTSVIAPVELELGAGFDAELIIDEGSHEAGGVISTDAYLADIHMDDLGLSRGLTDELSALTGAERRQSGRPQASVNALPDEGAALLRRDTRVDKETVLKIIDGIKNL